MLRDLANFGFEHITKWVLHNDSIRLGSFDWEESSAWIYAFVSEGRVRYVGIATTVLRSRMDGYRHQINDRVGKLIRAQLDRGFGVDIYGLRKKGTPKDDLESEETQFINAFRTDWNVQKVIRDT